VPDDAHAHKWQPNGTAEVDRVSPSPVSTWDDVLWVEVLSLAVCECGITKSKRVGTRNVRKRGDTLR
jgi:hypothetical protein